MLGEGRTAVLARMLNPDKQGFLVRRETDPRHFTTHRPDHETTYLAGHRVSTEHLIIAHAGKVTGVARIAIGENPQTSCLVETQAIRAVEHVLRRDVR
ncbi:hypothetical protein D3C84_990850 [compost metagenome]